MLLSQRPSITAKDSTLIYLLVDQCAEVSKYVRYSNLNGNQLIRRRNWQSCAAPCQAEGLLVPSDPSLTVKRKPIKALATGTSSSATSSRWCQGNPWNNQSVPDQIAQSQIRPVARGQRTPVSPDEGQQSWLIVLHVSFQ